MEHESITITAKTEILEDTKEQTFDKIINGNNDQNEDVKNVKIDEIANDKIKETHNDLKEDLKDDKAQEFRNEETIAFAEKHKNDQKYAKKCR